MNNSQIDMCNKNIIFDTMWKNTSSCWGNYWSTKPVKENYSNKINAPETGYFVRVDAFGGVIDAFEGVFASIEDAEEFNRLYQESK